MKGRLFKNKEGKRRRGVHLIPNILTTGNLFSGLASVVFVFHGRFEAAAIAILIAMIFDVLDGTSARLTDSTSEFGVEYDSLSDLISFGLAPGFLVYVWALKSPGMLGAAVMFAYVACGALRLARFNVMGSSGDNRFFTGLPIPAAAGFISTFYIFDNHIGHLSEIALPYVVIALSLLMSFLMVSTVKYRSVKQLQFQGQHHFMYLVWAVLILVSVMAYPQLMLFMICLGYAASGLLEKGWSMVRVSGKRETMVHTPTKYSDSKE
ncbi:CDP-diacylglycerol--serine O-phosphatidyltransferase [Candidatus Nitronereus thalassa]|uniref:CDP-diacylglycerol--serine O-phosphatidyltransferase n=1 Tax=Candidatus Nitronereus thalassa TaxID=3020898 RepID=A0ABU3K7W4_9BACT|nr:CDP-diacylglycerol--serine O-phosphatidyltransferase [Candidatus Nitronereus thalassa]MDT7042413.1 CDP-diacylglycerol--serine O-phosphatidyltransferase [Candidatus Nitronereus thalassa]